MSSSELLFDEPYYLEINEARWAVFSHMRAAVVRVAEVRSLLDLGCGPGWFSRRLVDSGLDVLGLEGRPELAEEARKRVPEATFEVFDFDAAALKDAPTPRDAVLAFGLLYHLENPLRALRICRAAARHTLFLETMTIPEPGPYARLVAENPNETQGLRSLAFVLTPESIVNALALVGFPNVYRFSAPVGHPDFADTADRRKRRDIFLATDLTIEDPMLERAVVGRLGRYDFSLDQRVQRSDGPR
jgi:SAM-dependent methyltransferase